MNLLLDIDNILDKQLQINKEYIIQKKDVVNFKDYFDLNFNEDSEGKLYPDVFSQFEEEEEGGRKKKVWKKEKVKEESGFTIEEEKPKK